MCCFNFQENKDDSNFSQFVTSLTSPKNKFEHDTTWVVDDDDAAAVGVVLIYLHSEYRPKCLDFRSTSEKLTTKGFHCLPLLAEHAYDIEFRLMDSFWSTSVINNPTSDFERLSSFLISESV